MSRDPGEASKIQPCCARAGLPNQAGEVAPEEAGEKLLIPRRFLLSVRGEGNPRNLLSRGGGGEAEPVTRSGATHAPVSLFASATKKERLHQLLGRRSRAQTDGLFRGFFQPQPLQKIISKIKKQIQKNGLKRGLLL